MKSSVENEEFVLDFIEQINAAGVPMDQKVTVAMREICTHYGWTCGVVYQTDGFRSFLREEVWGDTGTQLPEHLDVEQIFPPGSDASQAPQFFVSYNDDPGYGRWFTELFGARSMFAYRSMDDKGLTVGFVIFIDKADGKHMDAAQIRSMGVLSGLIARVAVVREYQARSGRAIRTLESIMNNMGVDIYVNSFETHDMLYANRSMAEPYGGWEHFEGKKCWQALYNDKTGECDFCPRYNIIDENGNPTKVYSWDYQRPFDKSWFRVFSAAFEWTDGQLAHVITSVDITHQKNIEEQLFQAKERAEEMDRQKSAFLANMGHEIRTPINAIVGFAELLSEAEDATDRDTYINIIRQNSELLMQLVNDILDLARVESGLLKFEIDDFDLSTLCEEIVFLYTIKETGDVPVVFRSGPPCMLHSDRRRLQQVITNFINNALKFTKEGEITLGYEVKDDRVEVWVRDTGVGIAPDRVGQIFDRFVKLNERALGTGLGLSICKGIIEQLHGEIGVESELGTGSRFWFTLPLK